MTPSQAMMQLRAAFPKSSINVDFSYGYSRHNRSEEIKWTVSALPCGDESIKQVSGPELAAVVGMFLGVTTASELDEAVKP